MKRLVDYDPLTGTKTYHDYDHLTKVTTISREADQRRVKAQLDHNQKLANDEDVTRRGIKNGMWKIGSIPLSLVEKWRAEEGIDVFNKAHMPRVLKKLQDRDFRKLATTTGRFI